MLAKKQKEKKSKKEKKQKREKEREREKKREKYTFSQLFQTWPTTITDRVNTHIQILY